MRAYGSKTKRFCDILKVLMLFHSVNNLDFSIYRMSAQPRQLDDLLIEGEDEEIIDSAPPAKRRRKDQRGYHWFLTWKSTFAQ